MPTGPGLLAQWIYDRKLSQQAAAAVFGITRVYLGLLLRRQRRPSLEMALRLEALTGIPPQAWPKPRRASRQPK